MEKEQLIKRIVGIEIIGFLSIIVIIWLDEFFDLPHIMFDASATPANYSESIFESTLILLLALTIIFLTHNILQRLKFFEGLLPICSFCKKIRSKDRWIPIEQYISSHSKADFTHGLCPKCVEKNYGNIMENKL